MVGMSRTLQVLLDSLVLSNYAVLVYIYAVFPLWLRVGLLGLLRMVAGWCSGRSLFHRICSSKRAWTPTRKGRSIQLMALHLRHSQSLQVRTYLKYPA